MASWHVAWPVTSTSTGTPAAVRTIPHRVAGTAEPEPPPAAVVACFPAGPPDLEPGPLAAATSAGTPVTDSHPHLAQFADHAFEPLDPARLSSADLVFLALPHEESAAVSAAMPDGVPVVDLSASFRLADPGARERIAGARRVASPGCYATAAILALAPLLAAGLADPGDIVIVADSGTSGAGRSPSAA